MPVDFQQTLLMDKLICCLGLIPLFLPFLCGTDLEGARDERLHQWTVKIQVLLFPCIASKSLLGFLVF